MALGNDGVLATKEVGQKFETFEVRMAFQAGYAQYQPWTSGNTHHRGIGYFHPFGQCVYYMGDDFDEGADYHFSDYFTDKFEKDFCGMGFAIYRLPDGDIFCQDGVFGTLIPGTETKDASKPSFRNDVLLNVVIGGTGRYEGARGLLMGTTEGSGSAQNVREDWCIPEGLLKLLHGYIKIPVKE